MKGLQDVLAVVILGSLTTAGWWWWESRTIEEAAVRYETAAERTKELNRRFAERMQQDRLTLSPQQIAKITREVTFANQLADKRAFSWARLLSDLEEALPPRVSVSSVRLNFQESTVALHGTAPTLRDLTALVDRLQSHGAFRNATLADHHVQKKREGSTGHARTSGSEGVEFNLTVVYRPAF
ncbi:MAG: PilN domain-containing protein [Nitrospirota bacterium]